MSERGQSGEAWERPETLRTAARDPGDAVPPGVAGADNGEEERRADARRDPGDAVPPGVAPLEPVELTEEDRRVLEKLQDLPRRG